MESDEVGLLENLVEEHPGYAKFIDDILMLTSSYLPPFIYINDTTNPRITSSVLDSVFGRLSQPQDWEYPPVRYARVNAVACFTARLFYDSVLNTLAGWKVRWQEGCENWPGDGQRWNDSIDSFLHGLKALHDSTGSSSHTVHKGKEKAPVQDQKPVMVIVIEKAERLKENLPELIIPLTRLAEMSQVNISTIFLSAVRWEDIKPSLGASPDPYYIDIEPHNKQDTIERLVSAFHSASFSQLSFNGINNIYHPALLPLYEHYAAMIYSICAVYTHDPYELQYIAAARWPGFVKPVLDEHRQAQGLARGDQSEEDQELIAIELAPPSEDQRMWLTRYFTPSITAALEALHPRSISAGEWALKNMPEPNLLSLEVVPRPLDRTKLGQKDNSMEHLPRMSKFILLAAFLASTNPAKTDVKMFGRGAGERKRRRRNGSPRKGAGRGGVAKVGFCSWLMEVPLLNSFSLYKKVPQRLSGPAPFPLDRLIAILGALLEENDVEMRPPAPDYVFPGEYTEMEIGRVQVYAAIGELTSMRTLYRTTPPEKLDGPPMFKCGIPFEAAQALARELKVPLNDLMWDPV
ncbi:putative origin recognition complex, subunit 5-like protein [Serpula lacrymans var. lacrymans S7.9]|uniref:Putative origin recognition complex, subunit 5-like protein n=1 Tax=Serpula lacrymans var. lacrymans (strain S7.9) TaxID=578457 RepID=F8PBG3_SERL9|nr:putative origin recognition complex, subunit 5-like protein [Serpula lacrymans var. lacrymans S7.9]EGO19735.1 putative origin recognition complex, subunit 5-like protein [Serpula lacrymans var. lacrymans S7.9]